MKRILFTLLLVFFSKSAFSQSYAYSFEGKLSPENLNLFETEMKTIYGIQTVEIKIKPEQERGELIFSIASASSKDEENEQSFSPIAIKQLFIKFHLNPLDFRQIK